MKGFFLELRKRHVVKVSIAYLVVAWLVLQLADVIFPALGLPDWSITLVLGLLATGFPVAIVLAWVFDLTPGGIERTDEAKPVQDHPAPETDANPAVVPEPASLAIWSLLAVGCGARALRRRNKNA